MRHEREREGESPARRRVKHVPPGERAKRVARVRESARAKSEVTSWQYPPAIRGFVQSARLVLCACRRGEHAGEQTDSRKHLDDGYYVYRILPADQLHSVLWPHGNAHSASMNPGSPVQAGESAAVFAAPGLDGGSVEVTTGRLSSRVYVSRPPRPRRCPTHAPHAPSGSTVEPRRQHSTLVCPSGLRGWF